MPQPDSKILDQVEIRFDDRQMVAWIDLDAGQCVRPDRLRALVQEAGIRYGLLLDALREAMVPADRQRRIILARGRERRDGTDGRLEELIERTAPYRVRQDGSLDFQGANLLVTVKRDQHLAQVLPPEQGAPGMTVLGAALQPKAGTPLKLSRAAGEGTALDESEARIVAAQSGIYTRKPGGKIAVSDLLVIDGDVDLASGSVDTDRPVLVKGDIKAGFALESRGSVMVEGCIEDAVVRVGGDLEVRSGILSGKQIIEVCGTVVASHLEDRHVRCRSLAIQQGVRRGVIEAREDVTTHSIVGGRVSAGGNVTCTAIGSEFGEASIVQAAWDMACARQLQALQDQLDALTDERTRLIQAQAEAQEQLEDRSRKARKAAEKRAEPVVLNKTVALARQALAERDAAQAAVAACDEQIAALRADPGWQQQPDVRLHEARITVTKAVHLGAEIVFGKDLQRPIMTTMSGAAFVVAGKEIMVQLPE
jgi:uncharacterized protein (DUF342 family)